MSRSLRILWLKTGPLHPLDTGGKLRTYHTLRELRQRHEITYLALCEPDTPPEVQRRATEYARHALWVLWDPPRKGSARFYAHLCRNLFSPLPYVLARYRSEDMRMEIAEEDQPGRHDLIVCDFLTPAINLLGAAARRARPRLKTLLFQHNVEAQIWDRLWRQQTRPLQRWYFRLQWRRLRAWEQAWCAASDGVVAVSESDATLFRRDYGLANVLGSVPTGVDVEYFAHLRPHPRPGNVAFLGSMDWMPNVDAVEWFASAIWPRIKQAAPGASWTIIGRNPPPPVAALARRDPAITVTGTVPDVRPALARAEALIVPLRVGGGTRIKIFEGMAAGLPVVSTRVGAEGLPVEDGRTILLADTPEEFAGAVARLLGDAPRRRELGERGRAWVREHFSWARAAAALAGYCEQLVSAGQ